MNDFEKILKELNMKDIEAPNNFEELLKDALDNLVKDEKRKVINKNKLIKVAGIFLAILFVLNFQNVSAYFKTLLGYDEYFTLNSYIKELNDENKIQGVNEEKIFSDGKKVIIEGLLYDGKFIRIFTKEEKALAETVNIEVVNGKPRDMYDKREKDNLLYCVSTFIVGEELDSITLELSYKGEIIKHDIKLDENKIISPKIVEGTDEDRVIIDNVQVKVNSLRLSPLGVEVDYLVTSSDEEKVKAIQAKVDNFFNEGIEVQVGLDAKFLNSKGGVSNNLIEKIDNGVRFVQQQYCNDPRIDKLKDVKLITSIYYSEYLKLNIKNGLDNTWIKNDLFIERLTYTEEGIEVQYWSRYYKEKGEVERRYSIQPINSLYAENRNANKELLGEDYKDFYYSKVTLMTKDFENNDTDVLVVENKSYNVKLKDTTISFRVR